SFEGVVLDADTADADRILMRFRIGQICALGCLDWRAEHQADEIRQWQARVGGAQLVRIEYPMAQQRPVFVFHQQHVAHMGERAGALAKLELQLRLPRQQESLRFDRLWKVLDYPGGQSAVSPTQVAANQQGR